jgi:hypothetical protein
MLAHKPALLFSSLAILQFLLYEHTGPLALKLISGRNKTSFVGFIDLPAETIQQEINRANTGACKFGPKNRLYTLDNFKAKILNGESNFAELLSFQNFILAALSEAFYLTLVCLDINEDSCLDSMVDPVFKHNVADFTSAFTEVTFNTDLQSRTCPCKQVSTKSHFVT